jgi:DNA-binding beta-propeller fold protein YncE
MKQIKFLSICCLLVLFLLPGLLHAEILAMINYETKPEQTMRREGIAIIDVDPNSEAFGKILMDIPLPPDLIAHHIYYNRDITKAYVTALGKSELQIIDMTRFPYRMKTVDVPECRMGEDMVFSEDNTIWYLTCLGSDNVIMGDAVTDRSLMAIPLSEPYPHGITLNKAIDRMLVTSTVRGSDLGDPRERISVLEISSGKTLTSHKVSDKPSPSGTGPVEVLFVPGSDPPTAYVTNMYGGTLWAGVWDRSKKDFDFFQVFDFSTVGSGVPLKIYFNEKGDRLYVTSANPGHFHIFDIGQSLKTPKLLRTIRVAAGAHHVSFSPDERYAFVQNSLLNLPGMSDGSIKVIDLEKEEVVASMDTLKNQGLNPNSIILLPEWYHDAGH